jgi:hypothetical protein
MYLLHITHVHTSELSLRLLRPVQVCVRDPHASRAPGAAGSRQAPSVHAALLEAAFWRGNAGGRV